jgi:hypothetical protein
MLSVKESQEDGGDAGDVEKGKARNDAIGNLAYFRVF